MSNLAFVLVPPGKNNKDTAEDALSLVRKFMVEFKDWSSRRVSINKVYIPMAECQRYLGLTDTYNSGIQAHNEIVCSSAGPRGYWHDREGVYCLVQERPQLFFNHIMVGGHWNTMFNGGPVGEVEECIGSPTRIPHCLFLPDARFITMDKGATRKTWQATVETLFRKFIDHKVVVVDLRKVLDSSV